MLSLIRKRCLTNMVLTRACRLLWRIRLYFTQRNTLLTLLASVDTMICRIYLSVKPRLLLKNVDLAIDRG